jgi:Flp pilus assembly pilin Flp
MRLVRRFLRDTFGQDVIEYALLAAFIGCLGAAAWAGVKTGIGTGYGNWDSCSQQLAQCTPDPSSSGGTTCPPVTCAGSGGS